MIPQPDSEGISYFYPIRQRRDQVLLCQPDREGTGEELIITVSSIKKQSGNIRTVARLKVHKIKNFLAPNLNFILFYC